MAGVRQATRRSLERLGIGLGEKGRHELAYWRERLRAQGALEDGNPHYAWLFTSFFEIRPALYDGARMLDIGCGPRGSLEWATNAAERVGLDPLAAEYRKLHSRTHNMTYVNGGAERIPFPDGHFDVISSINSLDHVDDLGRALAEIARVARPGALWLLLTDVNHAPTPTEPQSYSWDLLDLLPPEWELIERRDWERCSDNMFDNLRFGTAYDHRREGRPGILTARLRRSGTRGGQRA
jgi:SAM-dependent methyltransferase